MYISKWKEEEDKSYYESIISIKKDCTEIFKVRAVKMCDGKYMAVLRDYKTGYMLKDRQFGVNKGFDLEIAKKIGIELGLMAIMESGYHTKIPMDYYSYYKIPNFIDYLKE